MKVKHALGVGVISVIVLGGGVLTYAVGDTRADWVTSAYIIKEHGFGNDFISKAVSDKGYRTYVYATEAGVEFAVDTKLSATPKVVSDTYKPNVAMSTVLGFSRDVSEELGALGYTVDESSVKAGVSDDNKKFVTLELETDSDMSIFGLTDEDYDSIHEALSILSPVSSEQGYTLVVDFDDNNHGRVRFVNIDRYTTPEMVKEEVYASVQSQMGSSEDSEANK